MKHLSDGSVRYSLALNRNVVVHVAHPDEQMCVRLCAALRIEGYDTRFSLREEDLRSAVEAASPPAAFVVAAGLVPAVLQTPRRRLGSPVIVVQQEVDLDAALEAVRNGASDAVAQR